MFQRVAATVLIVRDLAKCVAFYRDMLGLQVTESTPERAAELAKRLLDERIDPPVAAGHAGNRERGIFVARLEHLRLRYACRDFPLPLRVPASGPTSAIRIAQGLEHGAPGLGGPLHVAA